MDRTRWPELTDRFRWLFLSKTREEWRALLEGTDAYFAPALALEEAPAHPHIAARGALAASRGIHQSGPAPHFSRMRGRRSRPHPARTRAPCSPVGGWTARRSTPLSIQAPRCRQSRRRGKRLCLRC